MSNKSQLKRVVTQSPEFAYLKITELETEIGTIRSQYKSLREQLAERDAEIARLHKGLCDASYALFQIKRMVDVTNAIREHSVAATDKANAILDTALPIQKEPPA
jgi:predicted  nucleic acid-binding Zn-ribbon protein